MQWAYTFPITISRQISVQILRFLWRSYFVCNLRSYSMLVVRKGIIKQMYFLHIFLSWIHAFVGVVIGDRDAVKFRHIQTWQKPKQTNTWKTTKNQENIPKGKQYVKKKVLVPPECLRKASDQLCGILSFDVTM